MRFSIRTKLFLGLFSLVAIIVALGAFALMRAGALHSSATDLGSSAIPKLDTEGQISAAINKYRKDQLRYLVGLDKAMKQDAGGDVKDDVANLKALFVQQKALASNPEDTAALAELEQAWAKYMSLTAKSFGLSDKGDLNDIKKAILTVTTGPGDHAYDGVKAGMTDLHTATLDDASTLVSNAGSTYSTTRWALAAFVLAAVLAALGITFVLTKLIAGKLGVLVDAANGLAEGDVDQHVEIESSDELGDLATAFRGTVDYLTTAAAAAGRIADGDLTVEHEPKSESDALGGALARMTVSLRSMIADVARSAQTMGASSQEMASTSAEAGNAVGEIARAVGDVAQGAERQVRMVEVARTTTEETGAAAEQALGEAQEGVVAAEHASEAMTALRGSTGEITEAIRSLSGKSEQIGGIVETITGIAGQTNLLALNAAIEAARAGEQGRGFAVVAEEVRKLAEESQHAAGSIADLIAEIQSETDRTVQAVEDGARRTEESSAVVEQARDAFRRIGASVEDMRGRIATIVETTNEVAAVAEQSSASAEQVSASTEQTSASAQQIAASAQQFASTAQELERLVAQFQL